MPRAKLSKGQRRRKQIVSGLGTIAYAGAQFGAGIGKLAEGSIQVGSIRYGNVLKAAKGLSTIYGGARALRSGGKNYAKGRRKIGGQKGHAFYGNQYAKVQTLKRNKGGFGRSKSAAQRARALRR